MQYFNDLPIIESDDLAFELFDNQSELVISSYIGGLPTNDNGYFVKNWPHFNDEPLPFLAQIILNKKETLYVFINDMNDEYESWSPVNSSNVIISSLTFDVPEWIESKPNNEPESRLENTYIIIGKLEEPMWLQGEEDPEDSEFIMQIPSTFNDAEEANFGLEGYGTIYVFKNDNGGYVLWQS